MKTHFVMALVLSVMFVAGATAPIWANETRFNPVNGHYYTREDANLDWWAARANALNSSLFGMRGHLATITSAQENAFITALCDDPEGTFLGGYLDRAANIPVWRWVTGEVSEYANWAPGEPNDVGAGGEGFLSIYTSDRNGEWNDVNSENVLIDDSIIEYEPTPAEIVSLAVTPSIATGVRQIKIKATLKRPAPAGGAILTVYSSHADGTINIVKTVFVPGGSRIGQAAFLTNQVSSVQIGGITVYGSNNKTRSLTIRP